MIPISSHQDSVGPIARSVADAAAILSIIAGRDRRDNYTSTAPAKIPNYTDYLDPAAIKGKRFGVPRHVFTDDSITPPDVEFNNALEIIRSLGGIIVDPTEVPNASIMSKADETLVFTVDFKVRLLLSLLLASTIYNCVIAGRLQSIFGDFGAYPD